MKKSLFLIIIILLFSLTSCKKIKQKVCKHDWKLVETVLSEDNFYEESLYECSKCYKTKIEINENLKDTFSCYVIKGKEHLVENLKNRYFAGEKVIIKTGKLMDANIDVKVNDEYIKISSYDDLFWYFEFIMPNKDVNIELSVSTIDDSFVYFNQLYYWVDGLNMDNVVEVRREDGRIGVAPGSLSNIVYSKNNSDIEKALNVLYSPLIEVSIGDAQFEGGTYVEYTFITLFEKYSILVSNNILFYEGKYYSVINGTPSFDENLPVYHSFITYKNTYKGYTSEMKLVDEFDGLDKFEFIKYDEPLDYHLNIGYVETEFGMLSVYSVDVFYIGDNFNDNRYKIIRGDDFRYVINHKILIENPNEVDFPYGDEYLAVVVINLLLDDLDINNISLDDEFMINGIYDLYSELSDSNKKEITKENLEKLNYAIKKINELKKYQYFNIDVETVKEIELFIGGKSNVLITDPIYIESFISQINQVAYIRNFEKELVDCLHNVPSYLKNYIRIDDLFLCFHNAIDSFYTNEGEYDFVIGDFNFIYDYVRLSDNYLALNLEGLELTNIEKDGKRILNLGSLSSINNSLNEVNYIFKDIEYFESFYEFSKNLKFADYKFIFDDYLYIYYNSSEHFTIYDLATNSAVYAYCANNKLKNIVNDYLNSGSYIDTFNFETYYIEKVDSFKYNKNGEIVRVKNETIIKDGNEIVPGVIAKPESSYLNGYDSLIFEPNYLTIDFKPYAFQLFQLLLSQTYQRIDDFDKTNYLEITMLKKINGINDDNILIDEDNFNNISGYVYYKEGSDRIVLKIRDYSVRTFPSTPTYIYVETMLSDEELEMFKDFLYLINPRSKYNVNTFGDADSIGIVIKFKEPESVNDENITKEQYQEVNQEYIDKYKIEDYYDILLVSSVDYTIVFYIDYEEFNDFAITYLKNLAEQPDVEEVIIEYYLDSSVTYSPNPYYYDCNPNKCSIFDKVQVNESFLSVYDLNIDNVMFNTYDEFITYFTDLKEKIENEDSSEYIKEHWIGLINNYIQSYEKEFFDKNCLILTQSIFSPVCNEIVEVIDVCHPINSDLYIFVQITHPSIGLTAVKNTVFEIVIPKNIFGEDVNIDNIHLIY